MAFTDEEKINYSLRLDKKQNVHKQDGQREVMGYGRLRAGATRAEHVCCNATTSRGRIPFNNNFGNFPAHVKFTFASLNNTKKTSYKSLNGTKSSVRLKVK